MATMDVNGVRIAYEDAGEGSAPPLLLVHGHPFNRSMWAPQIAHVVRRGRRVIAPDLRGYGESAAVAGGVAHSTTLDVFACDLVALVDALGIAGRIVPCGLSMGGQIVMEICRLFPERLAGIGLAATFPKAETEAGKRNRALMAERLLSEGMGPYAEEVLGKMLAAGTIAKRPALARQVLDMMRRAPREGAAAALRGRAERPAYEEVLAGFTGPALIVVGDEDAFTTRADALLMQRLLVGSELLWLEGIGHMPNLESEASFNAALDRLLAKAEA